MLQNLFVPAALERHFWKIVYSCLADPICPLLLLVVVLVFTNMEFTKTLEEMNMDAMVIIKTIDVIFFCNHHLYYNDRCIK